MNKYQADYELIPVGSSQGKRVHVSEQEAFTLAQDMADRERVTVLVTRPGAVQALGSRRPYA